jgi:hypothetical protein
MLYFSNIYSLTCCQSLIGKYFDLPPDIFPFPALRIWKWKSPLTLDQCEATWKSAEKLNAYEEYSKFGENFPTLDVSLDKLDSSLTPVFENLLMHIGDFIAEKFLSKLPIDGDEMKYQNGTLAYDKSESYLRFLTLKGYERISISINIPVISKLLF